MAAKVAGWMWRTPAVFRMVRASAYGSAKVPRSERRRALLAYEEYTKLESAYIPPVLAQRVQ